MQWEYVLLRTHKKLPVKYIALLRSTSENGLSHRKIHPACPLPIFIKHKWFPTAWWWDREIPIPYRCHYLRTKSKTFCLFFFRLKFQPLSDYSNFSSSLITNIVVATNLIFIQVFICCILMNCQRSHAKFFRHGEAEETKQDTKDDSKFVETPSEWWSMHQWRKFGNASIHCWLINERELSRGKLIVKEKKN